MPFVVCTNVAVLLSGAAELIVLALYLSQPHPVALYKHKSKVSTRINECNAKEEVTGSAQGRTAERQDLCLFTQHFTLLVLSQPLLHLY